MTPPKDETRHTQRHAVKAAVVRGVGDGFAVEELGIAEPIGREVLVEIRASGLCHSDLHFANLDFGIPFPAVLGHELAGIVLAVGSEVRDFTPGQHVAGSLVQFCGHCRACLGGETFRCRAGMELMRGPEQAPRLTDAAGEPVLPMFGTAAFAERALVHEHQLVAIPDEIPFPQACVLGCATVTGAGAAINAAKVRPGESAAVIGVGGIGLNILSGARLSGAEIIIAIDLSDEKLALATRFGATHTVNSSTTDPVAAVREITGGGADHAFEAIGLAVTTTQALRMTRVGGQVLLIGLHRPGTTTEIAMLEDVITPQRTLTGVFMGSTNIKRDIPIYAKLYLQGRLNLDDLISREISVHEIDDAYEQLAAGQIARSVITSW